MARNKNTFWLEIGGGAGVLQDMAQDMVAQSAKAITDRANGIYGKITGHSTNEASLLMAEAPHAPG